MKKITIEQFRQTLLNMVKEAMQQEQSITTSEQSIGDNEVPEEIPVPGKFGQMPVGRKTVPLPGEKAPHTKRKSLAQMLAGIKNPKGFKEWLLRVYFKNPKNQGKPYFDPTLTPDTVLGALSKPTTPLSLVSAMKLWSIMPGLRKDLSADTADADLDTVDTMVHGAEAGKYKTGDAGLKAIGQQIGKVTPTMVNKHIGSATKKIQKFTGGTSLEDMDADQIEGLMTQIDIARDQVAKDFAKLLKASKGNTRKFLIGLQKSGIIGKDELGLLSDNEVGALTMLAGKEEPEIAAILRADIERDNNVFKTFQNAVSKRVFPGGKRGRPSGSKNKLK